MNKLLLVLASAIFFLTPAFSQEKPQNQTAYQFTAIKELPVTPVKNQAKSGTCWSFSTMAFLEAELLKNGKGEYDLSEMFVVSNSYFDKADRFIRSYGKISFSGGSSFSDALTIIRNNGIVPESVMNGLNYGEQLHNHGELDGVTAAYVNAISKNPNGKLSTAWKNGFKGILDAYLGKVPESFTFNGKEYSPQSFSAMLGLNYNDYVSITSYTHHPFYTQFSLEVPDNWRNDLSYNIPIEEFMSIIDNAIEKGYPVLWGADVSEKGFTRKGIAIVPEQDVANMNGSDQQKWIGKTPQEIESKLNTLDEILPEKKISQEDRQTAYDNLQTTDDHGMLICGTAKDQNGTKYYIVKNSWGTSSGFKGFWYASETFVKYKTMNIVVNKNSIPKELRKKMGID
jgi:aminopeptidase C